jgi:hypothetical protein
MKNNKNLGNSDHSSTTGGTSAALIVIASKTDGIPNHQDDAAPSVKIHQSSRKKPPQDIVQSQRFLIVRIFIYQNLARQALLNAWSLFTD